MNYDAENFFNKYADKYSGEKFSKLDYFIYESIKKTSSANTDHIYKFLDIGCGAGEYAQLIRMEFPNFYITALDPSINMLNKIKDDNINRYQGSLPNDLPDMKYDYIQAKTVFHHVVGRSIKETKSMLRTSLLNIRKILNEDGYLLVHEIYYESYGVKNFSSKMIYHTCKLQNKFNVKIPERTFLDGLEVYFYTRDELESMLYDSGFEIIDTEHMEWTWGKIRKKILCLKDWGRVVYICKKR